MPVVNSLMKIHISDGQDVYLICTYDEHKNHLRIILLDHNESKAFAGFATDIDLMAQAATIHMVFTDFIALTLKALTKSKNDGDKFLYCLEENCESFIFKWKSVDQEETVISIGSIKLVESDYKSVIQDAFILLSEEMADLREKLALSNENLCGLKKEMEDCKLLLNDMNDVKERVEKELYSKFVLVLNEKKQKIKDLKRKTHDVSTQNGNKRQANTAKSRKLHQISDSSDEDSVSEQNIDIHAPSTSKCNSSLLFFDDDDQKMEISPSKKRNRKLCATTKDREYPANKPKSQPRITIESESDDDLFNCL